MADDVPVSDVLCEAMEYLSKLGSNLRSRSESLKEKRISKGKLKNFHAVQKAANKVLLICQLSKKSLDNVETGIRKVLSIADAQPITRKGGKTSDKNIENSKHESFEKFDKKKSYAKEKPHYHCFEYRSRTLKVAKKISVKHFTSVKVMAKRIPIHMMEKYPVYYNCKLYRMRERQTLKDEAEFKENKSDSNSSIENVPVVPKKKDRAKRKNCNESSSESEAEVHCADEPIKEPISVEGTEERSVSVGVNEAENSDEEHETSKNASSESECSHKSHKKSKDLDSLADEGASKTRMKPKHFAKDDSLQRSPNAIYSDCSEDESRQKSLKKSKHSLHSEGKGTNKSRKKLKRSLSSEDESALKFKKNSKQSLSSEDESTHESHKTSKRSLSSENLHALKSQEKSKQSFSSEDESTNKSETESKQCNTSEDESTKQCKSQRKSKYSNRAEDKNKCEKKISKHVCVIDSDSEDEKQKQCETNSHEKDSEVKKNVNSQEYEDDEHTVDAEDGEKEEIKQTETKKSLIKCVNLSKLLKPSLLEKACLNNDEAVSKTSQLNKKLAQNDDKTKEQDFSKGNKLKKNHNTKKVKFDDMACFWEEKRKMVKTFKPKEFSIHLNNLPEITVEFLQVHNLKKVTQGASVICEIGKEIVEVLDEKRHNSVSAANNLENTKQVCHNEHSVQPELIHKVKSALLNDSESDNSDTERIDNLAHETEKVKNSLLNESDSENDKFKKHQKNKFDSNAETPKSDSDDQNIGKPCSDTVEHLAKANSTVDQSNSDITEKLNMVEEVSGIHQDINKKGLLNDSDSACKKSEHTTSKCKPHSHSTVKHKKCKKKFKRKSNCRSHSHSESDDEKNDDTDIITKNACDEESSTEKAKNSLPETKSDNEKDIKSKKCDNKAEKTALYESDSDKSDNKKNESDPETDLLTRDGKRTGSPENNADNVENSLPDKSSSPKIEDKNVKDDKSKESEESSRNVNDSFLEDSDSKKETVDKKCTSLKTHDGKNENQQNEITLCSKANSGSDDSDKETSQEIHKAANKDKNNDSENKEFSNDERTPSTEGDEKEIAKSSLLKDSSGDSPKSIIKSKSTDKPKVKRKHVMESMQAKKMLLSYSSSSEDEEDEHLLSIAKDIQNNLSKILSSDEEKMPAAAFQRRTSSSDSDVDNLTRIKKKRKASKTPEKKDCDERDDTDDVSSNSSRKKVRLQ